MKYIYAGLSWIFGVLSISLAIAALFSTPLTALPLLVIALLLLPPVRNIVYSKTKITLSGSVRGVAIGVLVVLSLYATNQAQRAEEARRLEQQRIADIEKRKTETASRLAHYNINRDQILQRIRDNYEKGNFQEAIKEASEYLQVASSDRALRALHQDAQKRLEEIRAREREQELVALLRKVPATEVERNKILYEELVSLRPDKEEYKRKYQHYAQKLDEERQKEQRKKSIQSQFSALDGSHRKLVRVVKESMHDPDSYKHVETVYWDRGDHLAVQMTFRGKNALGAVVKNSVTAKVALNGEVVAILGQEP